MASANSYFKRLSSEEKQRYSSKISDIFGEDPYELQKHVWSTHPDRYPNLDSYKWNNMQVLYDSLDQDSLSPEPRNLVSRIPFSKYIYLKSRINLDLDYNLYRYLYLHLFLILKALLWRI